MSNDVAGPDGSGLSEGLGLAPEREAFARWLADTHAPALRRMDADGAHAAGYAAGVAAERERRAKLETAIREALKQARAYPWASGTFILTLEEALKA